MREIQTEEMTQVAGGLKWQNMRESINVIDCRQSEGGLYPCYGQMVPGGDYYPVDKYDQFVFD